MSAAFYFYGSMRCSWEESTEEKIETDYHEGAKYAKKISIGLFMLTGFYPCGLSAFAVHGFALHPI